MNERTDCLLGESIEAAPLGSILVDSLSTPLPLTECFRPQPPDPPGWNNGSAVEPLASTRTPSTLVGPDDCRQAGDPPAGRGSRATHTGCWVPSDARPAPRSTGAHSLALTTHCQASVPLTNVARERMQTALPDLGPCPTQNGRQPNGMT
jgi:hypothetical protein